MLDYTNLGTTGRDGLRSPIPVPIPARLPISPDIAPAAIIQIAKLIDFSVPSGNFT